jgi:hypothetical protein
MNSWLNYAVDMQTALLFSLFLSFSSWGQEFNYRNYTNQLCSPGFHGRGYVNAGDSIAAEFIAENFKAIGLLPITESYFQPFEFSVNTFPGEMLVYTDQDTLRPGIDFLVAPTSSGVHGTFKLIEFSYFKLLSLDQQEIHLSKNEALLIDLSGISSDTLLLVKKKLNELAYYFPILELSDKKLTWSVSQDVNKHPYLIISREAFREVPTEIHLDIDQKQIENHVAKNIIGFCPAKRKTKKTLLISAHYDHLGRMGRDTYFPGANDNASGTAMLLYLAEQVLAKPLKFNVLFVAFAGEEIGLLGSKHMSLQSPLPLEDLRFMLNLDIMGSGEDGITVVNSTLFPKEFDLLKSINAKKKLLKEIKPRGPAANSDHYYFTQAGVPAFFIYTMGPNKHYHDIDDRYEVLSFAAFDELNKVLLSFLKSIK